MSVSRLSDKFSNIFSMFPRTCKQLVGTKITQVFSDAATIVSKEVLPPGPKEILVKTRYVGINASDINITAGRYKHLDNSLPMKLGFEGVGQIVAVGNQVKNLRVNQPVAFMQDGSFSEYVTMRYTQAFAVPAVEPEFVTLLVSGLTAALALDKVGEIRSSDTVLVTGAAGGTGQFAVQWAKMKGCHVVGTCGGPEKAALLKHLGCDRVVDYRAERLHNVLRQEYPEGVDVVYEGVGGEMFDTAVNHLAKFGRLIVIGFISGYKGNLGIAKQHSLATLPARLLWKSASVRGFFLFHYFSHIPEYWLKLVAAKESGELRCIVDSGRSATKGAPFTGIESIVSAVEYLYSGKNMGKIVAELNPYLSSKL